MALATRCPHCQTTFRVAHDQLKLRAGLVRCGACKEIFNGVEHLLKPDEMQQVLAAPKPKQSAAPPPAAFSPLENAIPPAPQNLQAEPSTAPDDEVPTDTTAPNGDHPAAAEPSTGGTEPVQDMPADEGNRPPISEEPVSETHSVDPLQRMTLMDFTAFDTQLARDHAAGSLNDEAQAPLAPASDDEISQAIEDLQSKPWRRDEERKKKRADSVGSAKGEPGFMARARREKRYGKPLRIALGMGSALLFVALLAQSVFVFRDTIAARLPQYRPILTSLCMHLGCQVKLPAQIDKVSIESSELQSLSTAPTKFTLVALLRNQAAVDQAWPHLELTLNDMNEKPVARKVFRPRDYLSSSKETASGLAAQSEQQIKISFELLQVKASGYRVYLFYP